MTIETTVTRASFSTGSDSLQTTPREEVPTSVPQTEPNNDTALPQVTPKRLSVSHPVRMSESSTRAHIARGTQRPPFHNQGTDNVHRRTGSTLKTVMRKIFTRTRRSQTDGSDTDDFHIGQAGERDSLTVPNSMGAKQSSPPQSYTRPTLETVPDRLEPSRRTRRATLPSLVLSDGDRETLEGASPQRDRLGRSNSQHSRHRSNLLASKRHSRSTNALRNDDRTTPIQWRRSVEHVPSTRLATVSDSDVSVRPPTASTVTSAVEQSTASVSDAEKENITPNVGSLVNTMQDNDNASLEQRLTTLEVKLIDLEFALARMQTQRGTPSPGEKPRRKKLANPDTGRKHVRKHSSGYFPPVETEPDPPPQERDTEDRPLSTDTVRASALNRTRTLQTPSSSSLSNLNNGISVEQYSALVMLLRREQSARRSLESQVSSLRDDMQQLQRVARDSMGAGVGMGTMYPILSKDSQEFLGFRRDRPPSTSPRQDGLAQGGYDSDSSDIYGGEDFKRAKMERPRIEIAGMI